MTNRVVSLHTTILAADVRAIRADMVEKRAVLPPAQGIHSKHRRAHSILKNKSQFKILYKNTFCDTGHYDTAPGWASDFEQTVFSVCSINGKLCSGVSRGTAFRLSLDHAHYLDFALGWTSPEWGVYKASVVEAGDGKEGWKVASGSGGRMESRDVFSGRDEQGNDVRFRIHISVTAGKETVYAVDEVLV